MRRLLSAVGGPFQGNVTISNDGATLMKKLEIVHPAAKVLVDISLSQDAEVRAAHVSRSLAAGQPRTVCFCGLDAAAAGRLRGLAPRAACRAAGWAVMADMPDIRP